MVREKSAKRRAVLKTIGTGAGFSAIGVVNAGGSSDDTVEITTVETNSRYSQNVTKEVPSDWYHHVQRSRKAGQNLQRNLSKKSWFEGITRVQSSEKIAGKRVSQINVEASNPGEAKRSGNVPDKENGVAVNIVESSEPEPQACNTQSYDCVPGGAQVRTENTSGSYFYCSATCEVMYNGEDHIMTSAHCFHDSCSDDITGQKLKQGSEVIGEVVEYDMGLDFAVIEPYSGVSLDDSVIGEDPSIIGHVTKDGIEDLQSSGETVYRYGRTTCRESGQVDGITPCFAGSCNGCVEAPKTTHYAEDGDSGGPHYQMVDDLLVTGIGIIGPHWGASDTHSWAPAAYMIANEYDIQFGGSTCDGV